MKQKYLRIFISSTFNDFHEERNLLANNLFLKLQNFSKDFDVKIDFIDLRVGVTSKESQSGKTLEVCLKEIDKSKETYIFFIGFIGNRYGWDTWSKERKIVKSLQNNQKYKSILNKYKNRSITEIEIRYAILNDKNLQKNRSFFYFRTPLLSRKINKAKQESNLKKQKLLNLKQDISQNKNTQIKEYSSFNKFQKIVFNDLKKAIINLFPEKVLSSELEKAQHESSVFSSFRRKAFVENSFYKTEIEKFINSEYNKLILHGKSGLGKSTYIADFVFNFKNQNKDKNNFILEHYIGGSGDKSTDINYIKWRIAEEIRFKFFKEDEEVKFNNEIEVEKKFNFYLNKIGSKKETKVIICIDAIDQLSSQLEKKLLWIPNNLSKNIKFIFSIIDKQDIENLKSYQFVQVQPFNEKEKRALIFNYLKNSCGKSFEFYKEVLESSATSNPLYLKTLLNEYRLCGSFETFEAEVNYYLDAQNPVELFFKVFSRMEKVYNKNYQNLVKKVLTLLLVSRDGLSENELLEIINFEDKKLAQLYLSPLIFALDEHIVSVNGKLRFFHRYIRESIEEKYKSQINWAREKITNFYQQEVKNKEKSETINDYLNIDTKVSRELPWQLYHLNRTDEVLKIISKLLIFKSLTDFDILFYIDLNDEKEPNKFKEKFIKNLEIINNFKLNNKSEELFTILEQASHFFIRRIIDFNTSIFIQNKAIQICNKINCNRIVNLKMVMAFIYGEKSDLETSYFYYKEAEKTLYSTNFIKNKAFLEHSLQHSLAFHFIKRGLNKLSLNYYFKALNYRKKFCSEANIAQSYNGISESYRNLKNIKKTIAYAKNGLRIRKKVLEKYNPCIGQSLNSVAEAYKLSKKYKLGLIYSKQALKIRKRVLKDKHPSYANNLNNIAVFYFHLKKYKLAEKFALNSLKIKKEKFDEKSSWMIATDYLTLIQIYLKTKRVNKAKRLCKKAFFIFNSSFKKTHNLYKECLELKKLINYH
jgi:hypothetical protein